MRMILVLLPVLATLSACSDASDVCANDIVTRVIAPDGKHSAVLFQRDCGATTGFSTQISIVGPTEQPEDAGNVFRADDDHGAAARGGWGGPWAEAQWIAPDRLLIRIAAKSRVFAQHGSVLGIGVTYQTVNR